MKPWDELKAKDLMKSPVLAVGTETTLAEAARTMSEHQVSGLVVTDHRGVAVGVVSLYDVVTYLAGLERAPGEPGGFYRNAVPRESGDDGDWEESEDAGNGESLRETTVGEIMSPEILDVPPEMPASEVAQLLWERRIHRVFVQGSRDLPAGVISTLDLLGAVSGKLRRSAYR